MSLVISREGARQLLTDCLGQGVRADWRLRLYNFNITPSETDVAATYTAHEASFTGYAYKPLTRAIGTGLWSAPASQAPSGTPPWSSRTQVANSTYNGSAPQTWTCGSTGDTVYGYFITDATSGVLIGAEAFSAPRTLYTGDTLSIPPLFEMG